MTTVDPSQAAQSVTGRRKQRRTVGQWLTIAASTLVTIACFAVAAGLALGQYVVEQRQIIDDFNDDDAGGNRPDGDGQQGNGEPNGVPTGSSVDQETPETLPMADPQAKNFLITGADNGSCVDPDSPFAAAFGDRTGMGERSDTIMVWRIDPGNNRAAVLSLPRDLWVEIPGAGSQRINSAYRRSDPQLLRDTIMQNFGIPLDHFIQADFCAFKLIVDAVGGVPVPFKYPVRDTHTGLNVPEAGCFTFTGDHALAYARSRYLEYLPGDADVSQGDAAWEMDPTYDLGRISRQQDFLRRMLAKVLDKGLLSPSVIRSLYDATRDYVITDNELSLQKLLEFAGVLQAIDPDGIPSYQIATTAETISGSSVLLPQLDAAGMPEILELFRGERSLEKLPELGQPEPSEPTGNGGRRAGDATRSNSDDSTTGTDGTDTATNGTTDAPASGAGGDAGEPTPTPSAGSPTTPPAPATTVPSTEPEETQFGIVPDESARCDAS